MRLLYFNPENDLALAANDPHYTPPASALQMATDLQRLPLRWAEEGDWILLRSPSGPYRPTPYGPTPLPLPAREGSNYSQDRNSTLADARPKQTTPLPNREGQGGGSVASLFPFPWGWSPLTVTDFLRAGVPAELLPTHDEMQAFRTLAGRATAAGVLARVRKRLTAEGYGDCLTGEAHVCHTLDEARSWHAAFRESMFKQPWSGSGRGLLPAHDGVLTDKNEAWILRTLRQQGYVMAEPFYNRRVDFALEFWRHADGHVTYEGLSLFMTTAGGVYAGNIVATEERKLQLLSPLLNQCLPPLSASLIPEQNSPTRSLSPLPNREGLGVGLFSSLKAALIAELSALPPTFYVGPLGVDLMLVAPHSPSILLHPCVEINFRMTMGWLALHIDP